MPPQKPIAFELFRAGFRPSQIYDRVSVTRRVLYKYYQEYKRMQEGIDLEAGEIEEEILTELEAEEAEQRAKQEAERLQQEANEKAARQKQELQPLRDKLHSLDVTIDQYRWFPDNLLMHWLRFGEVNRAYPTPEEYLEALKKQREAIRIKIEEIKARQAIGV